ncbi:MAG: MBL fold metallo-hydrolase [Paludibacter sp.]|nr:MBL fold metallo-hydrolase [Paludibacter sp.]
MTIKTFTFNPFQENTYLVYDHTNEAVLIDAGCISDTEKQILKRFIEDNNLSLKRVINTHLHLDHQFGNKFIFNTFGLKPEACVEDEYLLENVVVQARSYGFQVEEDAQALGAYILENQEIKFGDSSLKAIHVPGHSPGSMAFYSAHEGVLFAGDVLFRGSIGRTDLPKGDYATLILSITKKLLPLPDSTVVYSGHGPSTTIGYEKINNPYL